MHLPIRLTGVVAIALMMSAPAMTAAETLEEEAARRLGMSPDQELLVGVVINRTITVIGRDFYRNFVHAWRDQEMSGHYSITVYERPSAIRGSEIWVQFGQRRVFQTYLYAARSAVKPISRQAAEIAYNNVVDIALQRLLFQGVDLGPEEI